MSTSPSSACDSSLWSIHTWWANHSTLIALTDAWVNRRFAMITLRTASGCSGEVAVRRPMLSPPPVIPEAEPTPTTVVSEPTLCRPGGTVITPSTRTIAGPGSRIALSRLDASRTVISGPPNPPVVPC